MCSAKYLDVVEGLWASDVIDHDDTVGTAIVRTSDRAEALLASSIPDLQLHCFVPDFHCAEAKVHSDSADVRLCEGVIRKPEQQARLADARVSNQHELEQVVIVALDACHCVRKDGGTRGGDWSTHNNQATLSTAFSSSVHARGRDQASPPASKRARESKKAQHNKGDKGTKKQKERKGKNKKKTRAETANGE